MRLTTLRAKLMMRDEGSAQLRIEQWHSAFQRCSQSALRLLSYPTVSNSGIFSKCQDPNHLMAPFIGSGLPLPGGPSAQALDVEDGQCSEPTRQEREKRGWWSLRFQQVLHEMSKS